MTTATLGNALRAHAAGSPDSDGELELAADFRKMREDAARLGRAKPRKRPVADVPTEASSPEHPA